MRPSSLALEVTIGEAARSGGSGLESVDLVISQQSSWSSKAGLSDDGHLPVDRSTSSYGSPGPRVQRRD